MQQPSEFKLKADVLRPLSVRSDRKGLWQAAGHFGAIVLTSMLLWRHLHSVWALPLMVLQGYLLAFLFTAEHECAHQTAFKTRGLNYLVGHIGGFALLLPYEYYRAFHWDHHRHTQDPENDPELLLTVSPRSKGEMLWHWSALPFWWSRIRLLLRHAVQGQVTARWIPEAKRPLIRREARLYLLGYLAVIAGSCLLHSLAALWLWVVPIMIGQLLLRPYLLAEHTGCAHTSNMLENTRTTYTNRWVRFFAWNMPYHVEHHAYPSVPFHSLPRLNKLLAPHITNTAPSYTTATRTVIRHVLQRTRASHPS